MHAITLPSRQYSLLSRSLGQTIGSFGLPREIFVGTSKALDAEGNVISAGGRVLCVAALGDSVSDAQHNAYAGVARIHWANEFHRSDIGWRAIEREQA